MLAHNNFHSVNGYDQSGILRSFLVHVGMHVFHEILVTDAS